MLDRLFVGLQSHSLVAKVAIAMVTAIGLLHLALFFLQQVVNFCRDGLGVSAADRPTV